ncbi:DUF1772 domain-containing protein [Streptomyces sp. NPDC047315]|uniref:anthrone oxygenase family protein n=1 Tax=Streptomyces sp. NPDC047315 TaxID=3155142 RepID=UPI0033E90319
MNPTSTAVLTAAIVFNGLLAGAFFAFACSVVPGLRRVDDATYVTAFRAVNRAILNGWFLTVFAGAPVLAVVAAVLRPDGAATGWLVVGATCAIATFVITAAINVPLNQRLDAAAVDSPTALAEARRAFEPRWNNAHLVRTLTSVAGAVALTLAVLV